MQIPSLIPGCFIRTVLVTLIVFVQSSVGFGQSWQPLGPDQRATLSLHKQSVFRLFDRNDTIYSSVREERNKYLLIKRFNGTSWDTVGTPFYTGLNSPYTGPAYAIITLDKGYTQYVAYPDPGQQVLGGFKPTVKKLVNGQWQTLGQPGIGIHAASVYGLEIDSFGTPYLLFNTVYDEKPTVMKFDGTAWVTVGTASFSTSSVTNPILKLDPTGTPYVAYLEGGSSHMVSVLRFANNSWSPVGVLSGLFAAGSNALAMTLKQDGFPVIAFKSTSNVVMEFDGTSWTTLPSPGNLPGYNQYLAVDAANMPYLLAGGHVREFDGTAWNILGANTGQQISSGAIEIVAGQPVMANRDRVKKFDGTYWRMVGDYGYSPGVVQTNKIAISSSGVLFSAFKDYENDGKLTVMKYVNGSWSVVGVPGFTADSVTNVCIAAGKNDTMFVLYTTVGNSLKTKVIRYDGSSWIELGSGNNTVSSGNLTDVSLATDTSGIPLVAFVDPTYFDACHVRKYENGTWTSVGGGVMNTPPATLLTLRVAPDNTIYLLTHLYLAKFVGGAWQTVGNYGGSAHKPDLRIDRNGTPYIAYTRFNHFGGLVSYYSTDYVVKFDGISWINLGTGSTGINGAPWINGVSQYDVNGISLAIDSTDRLYLASAVDHSLTPTQIVIKAFNGTDWGSINAPWNGWSGFYFPDIDMQLEAGNDFLYFAYDAGDAYLLGLPFPLLFLNVPEVGTPTSNVSVYPNPTSNNLTISTDGLDATQVTIEIIDVIGRVVKRETDFGRNGVIQKTLNIETLSPGSYLVVIKGKQERRVAKFIKE